jgi:predicted ribosomally synthesized peptide with SipW-like signal peptide
MDGEISLTRRRLLGGILTVGGASAAAGAGTMAAFSDSESSSNNTVQAGTLNLTLDGTDQTVTFLDASDIVPGDSGSGDVDLANTGSIDSTLEIEIADIRSLDKNGNSGGDLDDYLEVQPVLAGEDAFSSPTLVDSLSTGQVLFSGKTLSSGATKTFRLDWSLPDTGGINKAKGNSVELDLTFRLTQDTGA